MADQQQYVLFSAMKNEAPFILEWVAYHRAIGFTRIVVFSNDSDDGTTELLDALDGAGIVEHHYQDVPEGVSAQINAARIANEANIIHHGDWVIWIDADEFLNIKVGEGTVQELAASIGDRHGMLINWRIFGDSGNQRFSGRFISQRFTQASRLRAPANAEAKTFFCHSKAFKGFASVGINRPAVSYAGVLRRDDFVNGSGNVLTADRRVDRWLNGEDFARLARVSRNDIGNKIAQINHYCVRTGDMFALKRARGRGWAAGEIGTTNSRHTDNFYRRMNKNAQSDSTILRFESAVDAGLQNLLAVNGIYEAHEHGLRRTASAIARSESAQAAPFPEAEIPQIFKITLPKAEEAAVRKQYGNAECILEYGSGGSSFVALEVGCATLFSVESDPNWAESIDQSLRHFYPDAFFRVHFVNTGPVGAWSRPIDSSGHQLYPKYAASVWDRQDFVQPDVVLIDGRFRLSCFWTVVMRTERRVTILFDDYLERPEYQWIEEFLPRTALHGRMAEFRVAPGLNFRPYLTKILESYLDVR